MPLRRRRKWLRLSPERTSIQRGGARYIRCANAIALTERTRADIVAADGTLSLHARLMDAKITRELEHLLGADAVLSRPEDLLLYEYDGSVEVARPDCVVFPRSTQDVVRIVEISNQHQVPIVGRGAGTGLSGGALARHGGIVVVFSRMNRILEVDLENQLAVVQPGVVNLDVTRAVEHAGLHFAPDPSSQKACTIGGNISENAGGPHTLAYGVTSNHVLGLELVLPSAEVVRIGGKTADTPGYDLNGLLVGSEGTLAIVTEATLHLVRLPETVKTLLAVYDSVDDATETVVEITACGITPAACEMLDGWTLRAVEAFVHAGFPLDSAAVLLLEVDGLREAAEAQALEIAEVCNRHHAREVRVARDAHERDLLWKGRKNAFGAVGRLSPTYYVQDGVIPRTKLPATLRRINEIGQRNGFEIGNIFHAGDGNLHPIILFDARDADQFRRAVATADEIIRHCIDVGGAITGEHGVGMEKDRLMPLLFSEADLALMRAVRDGFNPRGLLNPGKIFPTGKGCGEIRVRPLPVNLASCTDSPSASGSPA
jgi:glycolate oxidase